MSSQLEQAAQLTVTGDRHLFLNVGRKTLGEM